MDQTSEKIKKTRKYLNNFFKVEVIAEFCNVSNGYILAIIREDKKYTPETKKIILERLEEMKRLVHKRFNGGGK